MVFALPILILGSFHTSFAQAYPTPLGEVYSETTYVPEYGFLSDNYLRFFVYEANPVKFYLGLSTQSQGKTKSSQTSLYEKNRVMPLVGLRSHIWKDISGLIEFRTEERSRAGIYAGNIWEYSVKSANVFSEYYVEGMILPSFTNEPIFAGWVKHGLRYKPFNQFFIDPYLEGYLRISPDKDLGRDTQQFRLGVRGIYLWNTWSVSVLTYQSFAKDEKGHLESLLVLGGTF